MNYKKKKKSNQLTIVSKIIIIFRKYVRFPLVFVIYLTYPENC